MTEPVTTLAPPKELPSPEVMSRVLLGGDLAQLTPAQLVSYYGAVCDSVGLNPLTKPFEFLKLSGKLVLYATRNCTDQLRKIYGISVAITARDVLEDTYVVTARATMPNGRYDESTGAVPIATLKGEFRANAMLKAETKAKRRVTLSLVGLSTLDESEVESIPGAVKSDPPLASRDAPDPGSGPGAPAAADLNAPIPESWKPFVNAEGDEVIRGIVTHVDQATETSKKGRRYTVTTVTLDSGAVVKTIAGTLAATARDVWQRQQLVDVCVQPTKYGNKDIVSISLVPKADADVVAF
jgi:hypothetical protein